jgi:hypothetical protein
MMEAVYYLRGFIMCQAQSALTADNQVHIANRLAPGIYTATTGVEGQSEVVFTLDKPSVAYTYSIKVGNKFNRYDDISEKAKTKNVICFTLPIYGSSFEDIQVVPNYGVSDSFDSTFQLILDYQNIGSRGCSNVEISQVAPGTWVIKAREAKHLIDCVTDLANQELVEELTESYNEFMTVNHGSPLLNLPAMVYLQDKRFSDNRSDRCFVSYIVPEAQKLVFASTENDHLTLEIPDVVTMKSMFIWGSNSSKEGKQILTLANLQDGARTESNSVIANPVGALNWLMPSYIEGFWDVNSTINNGFITVELDTSENNLRQYAHDYETLGNIAVSSLA